MNWQDSTNALWRLLGSEGSPVAVRYLNELPQGPGLEPQVICQSMQTARDGRTIAVSAENNICRGGAYFLGLIPRPPEAFTFWTEVERCFASRAVALAYMEHVPGPPPPTTGKYVFMAPFVECGQQPDLVFFTCTVDQAARLLGLAAYSWSPACIYSYAAHCNAAIGIPMHTGDIHVSFIDNAARRIARYEPGEVVVTIPGTRLAGLAAAIPECIWGTASAPFKLEEERLAGTWQRPKNKEGVTT